jgi:hypothetical protein
VTIFAGIARLGMVSGFSNGAGTVVAAYTGPCNAAVIKMTNCPLAGCMTAVTLRLRNDVVGRFSASQYIVVATRALLRRAFEYPAFVTRVTGNFYVRSCQRKASSEMIEFCFGSGRRSYTGGKHRRNRYRQECKPHLPDHALIPPSTRRAQV